MRSDVRTQVMLPWILATCFTAVAAAHHSTAEFDYSKQVTIKGTVKEIQWTNPHSYIQLIVDGEGGKRSNGRSRLARPLSTSTWAGARTASRSVMWSR